MTDTNDAGVPRTPSAAATAPTGPIGFATAQVHTLRNYDELDGGQGREVFFRADRFRSDELAPLELKLTLEHEGEQFSGDILDLASGGLGVHWQGNRSPQVGDAVDMKLHVEGRLMHAGEVRVTSVRETIVGPVTGLAFTRGYLDVEPLVQLRDVRQWRGTAERTFAMENAPWHIDSHTGFRALVGSFRLFLEDAQRHFDEMAAASPWYLVHGDGNAGRDEISVDVEPGFGWVREEHPARAAMIDRIQVEFVPAVLSYFGRIDDAMREASTAEMPALKTYSQRHLDELMLKAPLLHRARTKPLGYPGDFECMNHMYFRPFEGQTLFGKALHMAACASTPAMGVRARKDIVKACVHAAVASPPLDRPIRIASVASGPAQETYELLHELAVDGPPIEIVLFDQDRMALSFAQRRTLDIVRRRGLKNVRLVFLHDSIKRLLTDPGVFGTLGPFDLLFSTGLFDYLKPHTASILCSNFFANLVPGGAAYVGNMMPWNPARWVFEHHLEWNLIYRTHEEMKAFAQNGVPSARVEIVPDSTGVNPFVVLRKE